MNATQAKHAASVAAVRARRMAGLLPSELAPPEAPRVAYVPQTNDEWTRVQVAPFPVSWQRQLLGRWGRVAAKSTTTANLELLTLTKGLRDTAVPLDATDSDLCDVAEKMAMECMGRGELWQMQPAPLLRESMNKVVRGQGLLPPDERTQDGPAMARMTDAEWWRRKLRANHARTVEKAAIQLGYVRKDKQIYVSTQSCARHQERTRATAAMMDNTTLINELGQEYKLAELAALGPTNKKIKRAELMTRIAGFERIAKEVGHEGLFLTITCPSRMHRWRTVKGGAVIENPKYDQTTPREASQYLAKVSARIRAKLKRDGLGIYGFRIAEPQHDGTPHWHCLFFHEHRHQQAIRSVVYDHALRDSAGEKGAHSQRVDFKRIDWAKGSAAGYIIKYVCKNIDGYRMETDLFGNDAFEASQRVEAWARTHGIRQFAQIGGAPVGPWRELRRIKALPAGAPDHLVKAHNATNKLATFEGRECASVAWDHYTNAQGGVFCGRAARIKLSKAEQPGVLTRYGEQAAPKVIGVETTVTETYTPEHMAWMGGKATRPVVWIVESARHVWEVVRGVRPLTEPVPMGTSACNAPWTRVSNCTEPLPNGIPPNEHRPSGNPTGPHAGEAAGSENSLRQRRNDGQRASGPVHRAPAGSAGRHGRPHPLH